jgi:hypothetical protein
MMTPSESMPRACLQACSPLKLLSCCKYRVYYTYITESFLQQPSLHAISTLTSLFCGVVMDTNMEPATQAWFKKPTLCSLSHGKEEEVSSRIAWDTPSHFAKILSSIITQIRYGYRTFISIYFWMIKVVSRASFNTPTHWQWCFWCWYCSIFNSLSTINPHYHVKYSWLNHINVQLSHEYIGKIKWFADLFMPQWQHESKSNQFTSLLLSESHWLSSI